MPPLFWTAQLSAPVYKFFGGGRSVLLALRDQSASATLHAAFYKEGGQK